MIYMNDTPGMSIVEFCVYIYGMEGTDMGVMLGIGSCIC